MAIFYVRSTDGNDADDGSTWALAKATLAGALAVAAAGDTIYVSDNHAESTAGSVTWTSAGTAAAPVRILCVDDSAEPPTALATSATLTTTGNSTLQFVGFGYMYGCIISVGSGGSGGNIQFISASPWFWRLERCSLKMNTGNSSVRFSAGNNSTGSDDQALELENTTVEFTHASQGFVIRCPFIWRNTASAIAGATVPTTLFLTPSAGCCGPACIRGVDLSALGSGKSLVEASAGNFGRYLFENCKLGSSVSLTTGSNAGQGGVQAHLINCDSGDTNYRYAKHCYQGDITSETTIVKSSGASDGTTSLARKMVSSANSKFFSPLESDPIVTWNETTGSSITATVEIVNDGSTLTDAEIWLEVEYLGTSGFPLSLFAHDRSSDILATAANQTSSSVTWTTTGLGSPVKQKLTVTFTPQEKGVVKARVMLAKASQTVYFDPVVSLA